MQGWIISIVCVIVLGVLVEIVLPSGKVAKYVKGTFSLVVIFVIVAPLPKLVKSEWKFDFETAWQDANATFEIETKKGYLDDKANELENFLFVQGYDCDVNLETGGNYFDIGSVSVTLYGDSASADVVRNLVAKKLAIEKNKVQLITKKQRNEKQ